MRTFNWSVNSGCFKSLKNFYLAKLLCALSHCEVCRFATEQVQDIFQSFKDLIKSFEVHVHI